jgi:DNA-binding response OmpR family regulator
MSGKKILIIDDDTELCNELADSLKQDGFSVRIASNGILGLKLLEKNHYDILLLDFKMSGLTGIEVLKNMKQKKTGIKIFFMTGKPFAEQILREADLAQMVEGVIAKPFDIEMLLEKIKN